jgi:hypothetical protein
MPDQLPLFTEKEGTFDKILVPYNEPFRAKLWRVIKKVIFSAVSVPIVLVGFGSILVSAGMIIASVITILSTPTGEIGNELKKAWLETQGTYDLFPMIWVLVPAALFITWMTWDRYRIRKKVEKESEMRHKYWEDLDKLEGFRPAKIERDILYEVKDHLTELWHLGGHPDKEHNDADLNFLRAILERREDMRHTLKPSQEILQVVDTILERARKTVLKKQILMEAVYDKKFSVKWDLRSLSADERFALLIGAGRLFLWIIQIELRRIFGLSQDSGKNRT